MSNDKPNLSDWFGQKLVIWAIFTLNMFRLTTTLYMYKRTCNNKANWRLEKMTALWEASSQTLARTFHLRENMGKKLIYYKTTDLVQGIVDACHDSNLMIFLFILFMFLISARAFMRNLLFNNQENHVIINEGPRSAQNSPLCI